MLNLFFIFVTIISKINNMKKYEGKIKTNFFWIIPLIIGVSKNNIDSKANVYALHITPFLEIGFNWKCTKKRL